MLAVSTELVSSFYVDSEHANLLALLPATMIRISAGKTHDREKGVQAKALRSCLEAMAALYAERAYQYTGIDLTDLLEAKTSGFETQHLIGGASCSCS